MLDDIERLRASLNTMSEPNRKHRLLRPRAAQFAASRGASMHTNAALL
jgi:hypothetical protein